jgi:hypothetical protein
VSSSFRSATNAQPSTVNTFVATNGTSVSANENVNNAILRTSNLGRDLMPGLAFQTVDLTLPGQVYGNRINSMDLRVAKVLRFNRYRGSVGFDFYNLFNANTGTALQSGLRSSDERRLVVQADEGAWCAVREVRRHGGLLSQAGVAGRAACRPPPLYRIS